MADKPQRKASSDLMGLIVIMILIVIAWVWTGGYNKPITRQGPYLVPPTTIGETSTGYGSLPRPLQGLIGPGSDATQNYGTGEIGNGNEVDTGPASAIADILPDKGTSVYKDLVYIDSTSGATATDARKEYVIVRASKSNKNNVTITGWKIASGATGNNFTIGNGVQVFRSGQINTEGSIILQPGEKAVILTGRSPVGYSFRVNKCSGYLAQFQTFSPNLRSQCPLARDADIPLNPQNFNDVCRDYIGRIGTCKIPTETFPVSGGSTCQEFIIKHFHYNGCVDDHVFDSDFYSPKEWRIYLNRDNEIWKTKREIIKLLDLAGNTVDISSYWFKILKSATPAATETLSDSFWPRIGISATVSQSFKTSFCRPLTSSPKTKATLAPGLTFL